MLKPGGGRDLLPHKLPGLILKRSRNADHRRIVGTVLDAGNEDRPALLFGERFYARAETAVGRDAARQRDLGEAGLFGGHGQLAQEDVDDGVLDGGADVGQVVLHEVGFGLDLLLEGVEDAGLQAAEAEVELAGVGLGEFDGGFSLFGELVDFGAGRVGEAEHLAGFVEGFASRIVDGAADDLLLQRRVDYDQLGVATGDRQAQEGKGRLGGFGEVGQHVGLHMVDLNQWEVAGQGEGFGETYAYHQRADQARATGEGDRVDVFSGFARPAQRYGYGRDDVALVGAAGVLGHYAAKLFVYGLAGSYVAQHRAVFYDGGGGVVAAGFYG